METQAYERQAMDREDPEMIPFMRNIRFDDKHEMTELIIQKNNFRVERITSSGQTSDWYDQSQNEWVMLLQGEAELELAAENEIVTVRLRQYDTLWLPAHTKHRVAKTSNECIWLCVFTAA